MSESKRCASCGLALAQAGPGGLCPACLLKLGRATDADAPTGLVDTRSDATPAAPPRNDS